MKTLIAILFSLFAITAGAQGIFTFSLAADSVVYGEPVTTMHIYGQFDNTTGSDVLMDVIRIDNNLPSGWLSSFCTDICYLPDDDTTLLEVEAGDMVYFEFVFYSTSEDTGYATMLFRNQADSSNIHIQQLTGITDSTLISVPEVGDIYQNLRAYPNPALAGQTLTLTESVEVIEVFDASGKIIHRATNTNQLKLDPAIFKAGFYLYNVDGVHAGKLLVIE